MLIVTCVQLSSLSMLIEGLAGLPTGMDGRSSCPARANISLIRVSRKSLCEIFFPPHEDKRTTVDNGQVQQVEKELFCPLPCSTAGCVAIGQPICIINMPNVTVIIRHKLPALSRSRVHRDNCLLWVDRECLSGGTRLFCPSTPQLVLTRMSPRFNLCLGFEVLGHALSM